MTGYCAFSKKMSIFVPKLIHDSNDDIESKQGNIL